MSDGPHRSLPLGRRWKKVAELLDNSSFSIDEVRERLNAALLSDFADAVPDTLMTAMRSVLCDSDQGSLFAGNKNEIENLRTLTGGSPLGGLIIDCAIGAVSAGQVGEQALVSAIAEASQEWSDRHCRGMDEHYQRKAGAARATDFRTRVNSMLDGHSLSEVANRLVVGGKAMVIKAPKKNSGLDQGVSLR